MLVVGPDVGTKAESGICWDGSTGLGGNGAVTASHCASVLHCHCVSVGSRPTTDARQIIEALSLDVHSVTHCCM